MSNIKKLHERDYYAREPDEEDARILLLLVVKQAIFDYAERAHAGLKPDDILTAELFLFEEEPIQWGDLELTFEDICDTLDLSPEAFRERAEKMKANRSYAVAP